MLKSGIVALTLGATVVATPAVAASQIYTLAYSDSVAGLGTGPFGTVTVTENAGSLDFVVALNSGYRFNKTRNDNHNAFTFGLAGDPNVSVTNLSSNKFVGYKLTSGTDVKAPPFDNVGTIHSALQCTGCGPGYNGGFAGPLSFKVSSAAGPINLNSLAFRYWNQRQVFFTADLVSAAGFTGNVGAVAQGAPVPEPASWLMLIAGFGAVGGAMRASRRRVAFA